MASSDSKSFFFMSAPPQIRAPLTLEADDSDLDVASNDTLSQSEEEEFFQDDECVQLSPMHAAPLRVTPFAHLSTFNDEVDEDEDEDDDNEEEEGEEEGAPRIKMLDSEEENHEASTFTNLLPVSQSLLANDFAFFSGSDEELDVDEHVLDPVLGIRVAYHEYSSAKDSDVTSEHSQDNFNNEEGFGVPRVVLNELESVELVETDTTMQGKLDGGASIVVGDTGLLKSSLEDCSNSILQEHHMSVHDLPEHNSQVHCITCEPESAENVQYSAATQTTEANGSGGVADDQVKGCENLVSITRSVVDSNAELCDSSAGFESNHDAYESNIIHSVESCEVLDPTHLQECYLEKDLSETSLGVSLEDELFSDYHSAEHVEALKVGFAAKEETTVELNTASQESDREGSASDGDVEGLTTVALEQFREQISAFSILLGSKGSGKDSQEKQTIRISHGSMNLPTRDDAKGQFIYADSDDESDGSSGTVTSADESSVICLEDPATFSSLQLPYYDARAGFQHNITEKEKGKIQNIQAISVKFLRLVLRISLSLEDSLVSKVLYRLVADIERRLNQEFIIKSAKTSAKKLEENCQDDLDFSLNILLLGRSGVGKSATINSIFGDMKVVTNAFEPATTSVKEVSGTIDGIKIRILDTPGLKSCIKEQAYNRKILSSVKRYMKKFPPDVILYVDRVDAQTRDLNDLPILRSITSSLGPSIWQHAILTLTHAASVPFDGPSGSPLSYEVFVAQKSYLVQQSITQAVRNLCQLSPSFMCPVALVENHPLCGKNMFGDCVLPNGLRWRSQLLALCFSLKIVSEVSSISGSQTLFDNWKNCFFQDHPQPLCHLFSSLLKSPAHLKFSANWN
ncbi:Translocase of chloroplast 159, chloroplastic [Glycine soja]